MTPQLWRYSIMNFLCVCLSKSQHRGTAVVELKQQEMKQGTGLFEMVLRLNSPRTVSYKPTNQPVINNVLNPFIQGILFPNTLTVQLEYSSTVLAK